MELGQAGPGIMEWAVDWQLTETKRVRWGSALAEEGRHLQHRKWREGERILDAPSSHGRKLNLDGGWSSETPRPGNNEAGENSSWGGRPWIHHEEGNESQVGTVREQSPSRQPGSRRSTTSKQEKCEELHAMRKIKRTSSIREQTAANKNYLNCNRIK